MPSQHFETVMMSPRLAVKPCPGLAIAVVGFVFLTSSLASAQSASSPPDSQLRQATIFLEQVLRPWALVLPNWNRNPLEAEWQVARDSCAQTKTAIEVNYVQDASKTLPPESERVGDISFYRGENGLQVFDMKANEIRSYPDLQIGRSKSGTPVYQIGGKVGTVTIVIGRANTNEKPAIVLYLGTALYLSCRQPGTQ